MRFLDVTLPTIAENLALDEALLLDAEAGTGEEILRLWEYPRPAVVLGSGGKLAEDVDEDTCRADGVPILRRSSGGGTVLLGPGCLLYSLVLAYDRSPPLREIPFSYEDILKRLSDALGDLLPGIEQTGTSDLSAQGRKFSGNAQQRKRTHLLHHGTLLCGFDLEGVERYLRMPARQPAYREGRAHGDFLCNLPASTAEVGRRLQRVWDAREAAVDWPRAEVARLVEQKYGREDWMRRR